MFVLVPEEQTVTVLCLVRHGQSTWNAERRIQGQLDPPLSELGRAQANRVAERLARERWDVLYSSDLSRARQTAEAIARRVGLPVRTDPDLREQGQGKREGMLLEDANRLYPDPDAPEVGRETHEALRKRAVAVFQKIRDAHPGGRILVVAHGALMASFLQAALGITERIRMENTACTLLRWDGSRWTCDLFVDASHLEDLEPPEELPVAGAE